MWKEQLLSSFILFAIFALSNAEDEAADEASCQQGIPVEDFNDDPSLGRWYKYAGTYSEECSDISCVQYIYFPPEEDGTQREVRLWKDNSDDSLHILLANSYIDTTTGTGVTPYGDNFTTVGIDYEAWNAAIACDKSGENQSAWLLTRDPTPSIFSLFPAGDAFSKNGISYFSLRQVDQRNCPKDWSDAEKDERDFKYDDVEENLKKYGLLGNEEEA